jgi:circadian clock protein KaiC
MRAQKTQRLVLDSVSQMARGGAVPETQRQLLCAMVAQFKSRGVTSILTLESDSMYSIDTVTERGYSPIADNILMLRYVRDPGDIRPTVCVVKTRGSAHDWGNYYFSITQGGIRIGKRVTQDDAPGKKSNSVRDPTNG